MAQIELTDAEVMPHGHAVIEHEAVALPSTLRLRHLLQILEDAALEVINLLKALTKHIARRLLAANAAGAEHCDLLMLCRVVVSLDVVRKVSERFGLRVDRTFERTDCHFVVVTGVDQQHFRIGDQRVPVLRLDIGSNLPIRIHTLNAERDDLLLQLEDRKSTSLNSSHYCASRMPSSASKKKRTK